MIFSPRSLLDCFLVFVGSGLGGVVRFLVGGWITERVAGLPAAALPWGTLAVNVSGCFLLGLLLGLLGGEPPHRSGAWPGGRLLVTTGFLGGYTTFSTLMYDSWRAGPRIGLANLACSGAAGYGAVALGARLARLF